MIAAFTGSFDPVTYGHLDLIERSQAIVDKLLVVVLNNFGKNQMINADDRVYLLKESTKEYPKVEVVFHSGFLADFLKKNNINVIIRGLRSVADYEYEFQMSLVNKMMINSLETLFIPSNPKYMHLSSSVARQVASCGGELDGIVPLCVKQFLIDNGCGKRMNIKLEE